MPQSDIDSAIATSQTDVVQDWSVDLERTEGADEAKETQWTNIDWTRYFGYYKTVPELAIAIDAKATWTVGKGFVADEVTQLILGVVSGWGKDTFNTVLENLIRTYHIGGDAFAEIITDDETGILINLKPIDPGAMKIIADRAGRVIRYEQFEKVGMENKTVAKFEPEEILHLARNRVADEIHGVSIIKSVENIILMRNEAMSDWKTVLHRNVVPLIIWHLDTDDTTEIAAFKTKIDDAVKNNENMIIPKGVAEPEIVSTAGNATLNPLPWIEQLNSYFFQAVGVPQVIVGGGKSLTEGATKIEYLAFQQIIEEEQLFIEEQVLAQLNLVIELSPPASLIQDKLTENPKEEGGQGVNPPEIQQNESAGEPNDLTTEVEGRK